VPDEYPADEPASTTPAWAGLPTRQWGPVPRQRGSRAEPTAAPSPPARSPAGGRRRAEDRPDVDQPNPEQFLSQYKWRYDPDTLRELLDERDIGRFEAVRDILTTRLTAVSDHSVRARLLGLRAVVARSLGEVGRAREDGWRALAHAEATAELHSIAVARARLAHVLQWCGEYPEADRLFALADSPELPDRLRATMQQRAGNCAYEQGRFIEACNHFESALELRNSSDPDLVAATELALDAVLRRVLEDGWGPYPRPLEDILRTRRPPLPAFDEGQQRWGYRTTKGDYVLPPQYLDALPFSDDAAWVQLPSTRSWALIDESGTLLIPPTAGFLGVGAFTDGLAWVSRDGSARWVAIDKAGKVVINTGFDDVRPFRHGVAVVRRRGKWGAVDPAGRAVVPFEYEAFATAMHDGRYIDGFSDEGLAGVVRGGLTGVVDRTGRLLLPPVHPVVVIHPVAYLIVDKGSRWGALDRAGRLLIEPGYPSRRGAADALSSLLVEPRPVL